MTKYVDAIFNLSEAFLKQAELSEDELKWLGSKPAIYHRPTKPGRSASEIAQEIRENPLSEWSINGINHVIKLLEQKIRSGRLQRKDTSNSTKTVEFLKTVLREI